MFFFFVHSVVPYLEYLACNHGRCPQQTPSTEFLADIGTVFVVKTRTSAATVNCSYRRLKLMRNRRLGLDNRDSKQ